MSARSPHGSAGGRPSRRHRRALLDRPWRSRRHRPGLERGARRDWGHWGGVHRAGGESGAFAGGRPRRSRDGGAIETAHRHRSSMVGPSPITETEHLWIVVPSPIDEAERFWMAPPSEGLGRRGLRWSHDPKRCARAARDGGRSRTRRRIRWTTLATRRRPAAQRGRNGRRDERAGTPRNSNWRPTTRKSSTGTSSAVHRRGTRHVSLPE